MKQVSEQLFSYLHDVIYDPDNAFLDIGGLPEDFRNFGRGLQYYVGCVSEAQGLALALSKGELNAGLPSRGNEIAAPLKALHASLKHLTWQSQQIEHGDYSQRVEFMGEFSDSFNAMTRQLAQRNENESNERARLQQYVDLLLLTVPNIILILNTEGKTVLASESYMRQCNSFSEEDYRGKTISELFAPVSSQEFLDSMDDMINDVLTSRNTIELEQSIDFSRSGNIREYTVSASPMLSGDETIMGVLLSFHDMTEAKQAQLEAERARELAEQSTRAKSSFLANMSHEIRTPMNAILGVTEIILQHEALPKDVEAGLDKIYNSCNLLLGIINDILDFSKIEAGKLDIMPSQYSVADLINDSVQLNIMRIGSKPIKFEMQIDENIPAKLVGDELRIKQILNNLLSNSFKYTAAGMVKLSVTSEPESAVGSQFALGSQLAIEPQLTMEPTLAIGPQSAMDSQFDIGSGTVDVGTTLVLSVHDTGQGMTEDQVFRLFDEYSRFNRENEKYIEGTGLGLTITQRLISLMGGEINVESKPGVGSLFTVRLPQWKVDDEVLGEDIASCLQQFRTEHLRRKGRRQIEHEPMPYGSVLIVDDVETNLYVAEGLLKTYQLQVDTAMSGREAIDKINSGKVYDIVFMDHMMPEMDGIEAVSLLRKSGYMAPVVALTANAVTGQKDIYLNSGFDDFVSKPIDIFQFDIILNKFVRDKQPKEVLSAARMQTSEAEANEDTTGNVCCAARIQAHGAEATKEIIQENSLLLESFIRDGYKAAAVLDELCLYEEYDTPENLQRFTITVHGMKSSLLSIGETSLSESAKKLELAGREQDIVYIRSYASKFLGDLRVLLERIKPIKDEDDEDEDIDVLCDTLLSLQELCAEYNRKGALELLSGVKHCTKETRSFLDSINDHIMQSAYKEAETAAAAYISKLQMSA